MLINGLYDPQQCLRIVVVGCLLSRLAFTVNSMKLHEHINFTGSQQPTTVLTMALAKWTHHPSSGRRESTLDQQSCNSWWVEWLW